MYSRPVKFTRRDGISREVSSILSLRCWSIVSWVLVFHLWHSVDRRKPLRVTMSEIPGWARKDVKDALRFFRKEMPFTSDF